MPCYQMDGITPVVDPTSYVHPTAVIIGDVIIGANCYIGPGACLRGDFGRLVLEQGVNVQDTCVMHGFPGSDTVIEVDGHIGHGAVVHGAHIGRNALVGMNAVVMDGAQIGAESIVAACAFVKAGFECGERSMVVGMPAKVLRQVTDTELEWKHKGTLDYQDLAVRCQQTLRECEPLAQVEDNRQRMQPARSTPLFQSKG